MSLCETKRNVIDDEEPNEVKKLRVEDEAINITVLPQEILMHILSYLSTYDITNRIALVSKFFLSLTKDSSLLTKVCLRLKKTCGNGEQEALDRSKKLCQLILYDREDVETLIPIGMFMQKDEINAFL